MHLSLDKNCIIRSDYILGTDGYRKMFVRLKGTSVSQSRYSDGGYREGESSIIIQWEGSPNYDSGYMMQRFPATLEGLEAAHEAMDKYLDG